MTQETVHFHRARLVPIPRRDTSIFIQDSSFRIGFVRAEAGQVFAITRGFSRSAANNACAIEHQPFGSAQVEAFIFGGGKEAISERVPFAEHAIARVKPVIVGVVITQTEIRMKGMRGDELRVMALSTGLHGGNGFAAFEDVDTVRIEQREVWVDDRSLRFGDSFRRGQSRVDSKSEGKDAQSNKGDESVAFHVCYLPPHSMGSPG